MDDDRVWSFEKSLWQGGADRYRELVDDECLMALPHPPYVLGGAEAIAAVTDTPRWDEVAIADGRIARPQEGLIVIAYGVKATRGGRDLRGPLHLDLSPPVARGMARGAAPADAAHRRAVPGGIGHRLFRTPETRFRDEAVDCEPHHAGASQAA